LAGPLTACGVPEWPIWGLAARVLSLGFTPCIGFDRPGQAPREPPDQPVADGAPFRGDVETLNGVARPSYHLGDAWQLMLPGALSGVSAVGRR
jgi:hypothetical protein